MTDKKPITADDIALSFNKLGISSLYPPKPILSNVSGYVVKGGITAILGASASGKSVLMKTIAGRMPGFHVTGEITLEGVPINPNDLSNKITYVPQDDFLMGELTPRETLTNAHLMKRDCVADKTHSEVDDLLRKYGLGHVADNMIGTVFVRGLSGGQRKRVEVCSELVAPYSILFLDEPTSGLDGSIAYEVLSATKKILESKKGELSLIISIHQPNRRILDLFDNILLLGNGGELFFGTLDESIDYFTHLGFPPPSVYTPTDVFLQVTDSNFGENQDFDFEGNFAASKYAAKLHTFLAEVQRSGMYRALKKSTTAPGNDADSENDEEQGKSWKVVKVRPHAEVSTLDGPLEDPNSEVAKIHSLYWRQFTTLLKRDFTLAYRDPSLYYLQFVLVLAFGFLVGASFFQLDPVKINSQMLYVPSGLLWIVMMMIYIQVFKVYHLSRADWRFKHEISNKTYNIFIYWLAELTSTAILLVSFIPGTAVAYFMMGLPNKAYPFLMLLFWLTALTAESLLNLITKFSEDATVSIVSSQAVLVILTVFGGGMFIAWDDCPNYWYWLQELSLFTQASRSAIMNVNDFLDYKCRLAGNGACYDSYGNTYPCDASPPNNGYCEVSGRMVLNVLQGTAISESKWIPFGYLVLIFVCLRGASLFLMYYPVQKIMYQLQDFFAGVSSRGILDAMIGLRRVEGQLNAYIALHSKEDAEKGLGESHKVHAITHNLSVATMDKSVELSTSVVSNERLNTLFPANRTGHCLEWKDLSVTLKKSGQVLIHNVSGVALPGRILALMGPSGAGKTTLLNALSNRTPYATLSGDISFGKRQFTSEDLIYVPQFDEFNQNMTVYETLQFIGEMKCADKAEMMQRLGLLLRILGLADTAHTSCRELTSGQLKRVSVGMGMISNPNVLFLDEPTTGLDSSAAYSIVKYLSELSYSTNVVVIMTIHQPAQIVFDMLQDLYLLERGYLAYFGPSSCTQLYFKQLGFECGEGVNPADFYLDLVNNNYPYENDKNTTWNSLYNQSILATNVTALVTQAVDQSAAATQPSQPPSLFLRFLYMIKFFVRYYLRDVGFYYLRLGFLVLIALFLGTLFLQLQTNASILGQYSGALFFNIWTVLFSAVAATGLLAADRRQAIEQVKNAVIVPSIYCLAQFVVSIPFNFFCAVVFQSIFHWLTNINPHGEAFIYSIMITCGHLLLMEAIMLTVVAVLKNAMLSVTFAMVVMGYLFLFSGFFILITDMPPWISWISYITPTMYSFHGYLWQIYENQNFHPGFDGKMVLDKIFDLRDVNSWGMFGALLGWIFLFRIAHFVVFELEVMPYLRKPEIEKK